MLVRQLLAQMIDTPRSYPTPVDGADAPPISPERWALLEPLIDAALDLAPSERDAYYDRVANGDHVLRQHLARLVAACERDDALLDAPAGQRFASLFEETPPLVLNERFVIEREIGRGGMAVVYLAYDRKHDRQVAVKVLSPDAAAAIGADRFDREIKLVARLHHPNIVPLYDSGDEQDWLYYVMPVMLGGSLRQRLASGQPLPVETVQRITRDIAGALAHAHAQNVVHRDVKPENILFDGDRAMLADFGVARPPLTAAGGSAGTPAYMSPEQAGGRGSIDARSDVYSLAAVVQEMVTGSAPSATPESAIASRSDVPRSAHEALRRALTPDANERFLSAPAFEHAFSAAFAGARARRTMRRWAVAAGAVAALALGGYAAMRSRVHHPKPDAFELYMRGTDQRLFRSDTGTRAAIGLLSRAVATDSLFPAAFAALSRAYNATCLGLPPSSRVAACDSGVASAKRAIALDSTLGDGYAQLAWASLNRLDFSSAENAARRATIVDPTNTDAHDLLSGIYFWLGRSSEAVAESRRAVAANPRSIDAIAHLGWILAMVGREDEALVLLQPLRSLRPKVRRVSDAAETVYEARGMWSEAMLEAGNDSGKIARILAESGHGAGARTTLEGLEARWNRGRGRAWDVAGVYFGLHEYDSAFVWLNRSVDDISIRANVLGPAFAGARADPRFQDVMRRIGVPTPR